MEENKLTQDERLINLGQYYLKEGYHEFAIDVLTRVIDLKPKNTEVFNLRGIAYGMAGQYEESIADLNVFIETTHCGSGYGNRGLTYYYYGMLDEALSDFNRAIELSSDKKSYFADRGLVWNDYAEYDQSKTDEYLSKAIADFSEAITLGLADSNVYENRGEAYLALGEINKALADFHRAEAIDLYNIDPQVSIILVRSRIDTKLNDLLE